MFRNFPDLKGIKTAQTPHWPSVLRLETSLTSKGLRRHFAAAVHHRHAFRNFPDSKGIKTQRLRVQPLGFGLETSLTPKGLRLKAGQCYIPFFGLETSLASKKYPTQAVCNHLQAAYLFSHSITMGSGSLTVLGLCPLLRPLMAM